VFDDHRHGAEFRPAAGNPYRLIWPTYKWLKRKPGYRTRSINSFSAFLGSCIGAYTENVKPCSSRPLHFACISLSHFVSGLPCR
jgi:hypothetical protein